jgi:hypothetical protein
MIEVHELQADISQSWRVNVTDNEKSVKQELIEIEKCKVGE